MHLLPNLQSLRKGLSPSTKCVSKLKELRTQRQAGCSHTHGTMGFSSFAHVSHLNEAWTPIFLLMSARMLDHFRKLAEFLIHGKDELKQGLEEGVYFSFLLQWPSHSSSCQLLHFPHFLLLRFRLWSKPEGIQPDMRCSSVAFDCLDASSDHYCPSWHGDSISQMIYLVSICGFT